MLHFNCTQGFIIPRTRMEQVAFWGLWEERKPNFINFFPHFWRGGWVEGVLINRWFKQHDCWQHTPPLNLTALIKLTVAIKHIPRKYVSNDTWSLAGHLCRKLYSKILLKQLRWIRVQSGGRRAQFETQRPICDFVSAYCFMYFLKQEWNLQKSNNRQVTVRRRHLRTPKTYHWLRLPLYYIHEESYTLPCHFKTAIDTCVFHSAFWR